MTKTNITTTEVRGRRYLTDPVEIRNYRLRYFKRLFRRIVTSIKRGYHRFIFELVFIMAATGVWLGCLGLGVYALTYLFQY